MPNLNRIPTPSSWDPSAVPELAPKPPQRYTKTEFPSVESAVKRVAGVPLPFADLSRGAGSLVNNAAVLASSPLLAGLLRPEYAENEMVPAGLSPMGQDEASRVLAAEAGMGGQSDGMRSWANAPRSDSGAQVRDMRALLSRRQP